MHNRINWFYKKIEFLIFKLFIAQLILFFSTTVFAQRKPNDIFFCAYGEGNHAKELCKDFQQRNLIFDDAYAEKAVDRILEPLGLDRKFVLVPCDGIENAVAITPKDGFRYILYDRNFMEHIDRTTSDWSGLCILAHEIGHHLCGHTLIASANPADQRQKELEADAFAGFIMYKLRATLIQAQAVLYKFSSEKDDTYSDHPKLSRRLTAVESGYNRARRQQPISNIDYSPSAEKFFEDAYKLCDNGHYQESIEKYTVVIGLKPDYPYAYCNRGYAKSKLKDNQGAMSDYTKSIEIDPNNILTYINKGSLEREMKRFEDALNDFDKVISLGPADMRGYYGRGITRIKLKDYIGAKLDFSMAIKINPKDGDSYLWLGNAKYYLKDYQGALENYDQVIELDPTNSEGYHVRGLAKFFLNDITGACEALKKGCNLGDTEACQMQKNVCH